MPSNRRLTVFPEAEEDLRSILRYTVDAWGEQQRMAYAERLDAALERIGNHPFVGQAREELGASLRSLKVGDHIVIYRVEDLEIQILRVLHSRMDIANQFNDMSR